MEVDIHLQKLTLSILVQYTFKFSLNNGTYQLPVAITNELVQ